MNNGEQSMIGKDEFESLNDEIGHKIAEVGYLLGLAKSGQHMDKNEFSLENRRKRESGEGKQ